VKEGNAGREEQARKGTRCSIACACWGALKKREARELAASTCASGSVELVYEAEALAYEIGEEEEGF